MPTGKRSHPASNWRGLLYVFVIASGLCLSSFVDASHAVVSMEGTLTKSFTSMIPESAKTISEAELSPTDTKLTEIKIQVNIRVVASELSVQKYDSRPADAATDAPGDVYRYMSISFTNLADGDIQSASIKFKVEKSWIEQNSVDASSAALYRYGGGVWNKLQTAKTGEDGAHVYYEAATPGFSYFAISAEKAATPATSATIAPGQAATSTVPGAPAPSAALPTQPQGWWAWIAAATVLVAAATVLALKPKPPAIKRRRRGRR